MGEAFGRFQELVIEANRSTHMSEHMTMTSICQIEWIWWLEQLTYLMSYRRASYNSWAQSIASVLMPGQSIMYFAHGWLQQVEIEHGECCDAKAFFHQSTDHIRPVW